MPRTKKTKNDFPHDDQGRAILGTAKEMATWIKLGFEEQDRIKSSDEPFYQHYIDFSKCVLYISYPIGSKTPVSKVFNLCHMAGIVPGIEEIEDDPNFHFEVKYDIHFDGSVLYGNFFHYVKFDGLVRMDNATVHGTFSCFKCLFDSFVYMQGIHLKGGYSFEQCEFTKGLIMSGAVVGGITSKFNYCVFNERLSLAATSFSNQRIEDFSQSIGITNSTVGNLIISKISTDGLPLFIEDSTIHGMQMNNLKMDGTLGFYSCVLDEIVTSVIDENQPNNSLNELVFFSTTVRAQYHIENSNIEKLSFTFGEIADLGRLRVSQCNVGKLLVASSSVIGRMDIIQSKISSINLEETCVPGFLIFQSNDVTEYENRQTLRLLKNEALKINDRVSALPLFSEEMQLLLSDKSISKVDKVSLRLNKLFSNFGGSWIRALLVTFGSSVFLTLLMLGLGSTKYKLDISGVFIGVGAFVTILLDSINVFSIPLFSDTIQKYGLNVFGQILYFFIKVVVAYGVYQFVLAFRKHGRS